MKKKLFYNHLVTIDSLVTELDLLELSEDEKNHLIEIAATSIHYSVLDISLSELNSEDQNTFMAHINAGEHEEAWQFLKEKAGDIDQKIIEKAEELKNQFRKDIDELKKKS